MKKLFLPVAIVLPALVFAFWQSEAAGLQTLRGDEAAKQLEQKGQNDSLMEAVQASRGRENMRLDEENTQDVAGETAKLTASDGAQDDYFGYSVAVSGDTAVVGAWLDDVGSNTEQGSAYVFTRAGTVWTQQAQLIASDGTVNDSFGISVAVSGDTVVVGSYGDNVGANINQGSAYVYTRSVTTWTQQAQLTASDGAPEDRFGRSVAVSGDTVVVGAVFDDVGSNLNQGSAYVFTRAGTTWMQQARLTASDGAFSDGFGVSVAVSGDTALVGAQLGLNTNEGAAYVFTRGGTVWTQQAQLTTSNPRNASFGESLAISGDTAVVGAVLHFIGTNENQGAAYVFTRVGTVWTQQAQLIASDGAADDFFGISVAVSGDTAVVGAYVDDVGSNTGQGSAYIFNRAGTVWTQQARLTASDGAANDFFGFRVAISGQTVVVGAYFDDVGSNTEQGSAYVFTPPFVTSTPTPTPTPTPIPVRNLRVETSYVAATGPATVPIRLITSTGNEGTVSFSLSYETSRLGSPSVACGPDAPGCTIMQNTSTQGFIGVVVTFATLPTPGERRILTLTFASATGGASNTPVLFTSTPTPQVTRDSAGNQLPTGYTGGFVVFTERGLEGDLATRFSGDGVYRSNDVEQLRAFLSGTEQPNAVTNEFERADVAPYETKGDGRLRAEDFQLVKNYIAGLVGQQTAGGPDVAVPAAPLDGRRRRVRTGSGSDWVLSSEESRSYFNKNARAIRIVGPEATAGNKLTVTIDMDSLGDETVALLTLNFDPSILQNPVVNRTEEIPESVTLTVNTSGSTNGQVTILLDSATPFITGYSRRLVAVTFDVAKGAAYGETAVTFDDSSSLADADARSLTFITGSSI